MSPKKRRRVAMVIAVLLAVLMILSLVQIASAAETEAVSTKGWISVDGVYINDLAVGGMTESEIKSALEKQLSERKQDAVVLYAGDAETVVSAGELGLTWSADETVKQAVRTGNQGNVLKRFQVQQALKENGSYAFRLPYQVSLSKIKSILKQKAGQLETKAIPTAFPSDSKAAELLENADSSLKIDIDASAEKIKEYMEEEWTGGQGEVRLETESGTAAEETAQETAQESAASGKEETETGNTEAGTGKPAAGTEQETVKHAGNDILGFAETYYDTGNAARAANLQIAASRINGTELQPGEKLDFSGALGARTAENGFEMADSYQSGNSSSSYGGGICQVATTLYQAVLKSGLAVTERSAHTALVGYAEPALDAAISQGTQNLVFENDSKNPVAVYAAAGNGVAAVMICGTETRKQQEKPEIESRVLERQSAAVHFTPDPSLPFGVVKGSGGRGGADAEAWRITGSGADRKEEKINDSVYVMIPLTYSVGTKGATDQQLRQLQKAMTAGKIEDVWTAVYGG